MESDILVVVTGNRLRENRSDAKTDVQIDAGYPCHITNAVITIPTLDRYGNEIDRDWMVTMLGHEFGHALGGRHVRGSGHLMSERLDMTHFRFTSEDVKMFKTVLP